MKRYSVENGGVDDEGVPIIVEEEDRFGDWVKYEEANNEIWELRQKIEELELALNRIYDIASERI